VKSSWNDRPSDTPAKKYTPFPSFSHDSGFIPSDTTGAINLFRDNVSGTDVNFNTIRNQSPNPIDRQRYATWRAWQAISAEPAAFARKFIYSSLIGWSPGDFPHTRNFIAVLLERPRTASLLTHLTMLLWLAVPLAVLGMLFAPRAAPGANGYRAVMLAMALLYTVLIGVTHFEERYRLPYLLLWLPYAGWCLSHPRALLARLRRPAGLIAVGAVVVVSLFYIPLVWPAQWDDARAAPAGCCVTAPATWPARCPTSRRRPRSSRSFARPESRRRSSIPLAGKYARSCSRPCRIRCHLIQQRDTSCGVHWIGTRQTIAL
jgi:hypothetical protein